MHYLIDDEHTGLDALTGLLGRAAEPLQRFESRYLGGQAARGAGLLIRPNVDVMTDGPYLPEEPDARYIIEFDAPPTDALLEQISAALREAKVGFRFVDD